MPITKRVPQKEYKSDIAAIKKEIEREREKLRIAKVEIEEIKQEIKDATETEPEQNASTSKSEENENEETAKQITTEDAGHDSEYKIRFENQAEINRQLMREIETLKKRVDQEKKNFKKGTVSVTDESEYQGAKGKKLLIRLEREKLNVHSLIRDYEWKLDQEARTFHKVNERCAQMIRDIQRAGGNVPTSSGSAAPKGVGKKRRESKALTAIPELSGANGGKKEKPSAVERKNTSKK